MWQFGEITTLNFAGTTSTFTPDTIKLSVTIRNWPFASLSNSLSIVMEATESQQNNLCVNENEDSNNSLRWVMIVVDDVALYLLLYNIS